MSLAQLQSLKGRVALVTGGSRGLGYQMAEALGELGARVAITARKQAELDEAVSTLRGQGIEAIAIACDVGELAALPALVEQVIEKLGPIDILVNNAGTSWGGASVEQNLEAWNKVLTVNVTATFALSQEVARRCMLPRRSGRVINIASIQGLTGSYPPGVPMAAYNTSKGAIINLTRTLAHEWGAQGINVNAIAPGYFPTKMTAAVTAHDSLHEASIAGAPLKRAGGAEDMKGVTALLASDAGAFITGQTIAVDGGVTAI